MADDTQTIYEIEQKISDLKAKDLRYEREINKMKKAGLKMDDEKLAKKVQARADNKQEIKDMQEIAGIEKDILDYSTEIEALEEKIGFQRQKSADFAADIGKSIQEQVESIPLIGASLSKNLKLDELSAYFKAKTLLMEKGSEMTAKARKELEEKIKKWIIAEDRYSRKYSFDVYTGLENFITIHGAITETEASKIVKFLRDDKEYKITTEAVLITNENYKVIQINKNLKDFLEFQKQ